MALGNIVGAIAAGLWFLRGTWKEAVIDEGPGGPDVDGPESPSGSGIDADGETVDD
jgi:hypothetical protein